MYWWIKYRQEFAQLVVTVILNALVFVTANRFKEDDVKIKWLKKKLKSNWFKIVV